MDRIPTRHELTAEEFSSLCRVSRGFTTQSIPRLHQIRLIELGLIQKAMGGLMPTPAGRNVARAA